MGDTFMTTLGVLFLLLWLFMFGLLGFYIGQESSQQSLIERGYGLYCPNTGEFAFVGECE